MEDSTDVIKITIEAVFNSRKKSKEEVKAFIKDQIERLEEAILKECNISGKNFIEIVVSIPQSVFDSQGPNSISEIEEFISFLAPMFLIKERMPVKIKTVKAELSL